MNKLFKSYNLNLEIKVRLLGYYIFSILYYGFKSWILTEAMEQKLETFEMWIYKRILRISWTDKITNETVLRRMGKEREVMKRFSTTTTIYLKYQLIK
ncbi:unnamed protein product [Diabrotica balteata]|uniref:Uncharacterized protein n=1 Tax=Diabrotica balteata TaxID=107213 RepID=A0A9N9XCL5_DIABA|nr:unnamed protein product [Diabrotica balteata]